MATNFPHGLKSRGAPVEALSELGKVWGDVHFVDASAGNDTNRGDDVSKAFASISAAVNTASAGDTIYVRNGAYTETLTLDKQIRLIGESKEGVKITAGADAVDGVTVTASNCEIDNVTFLSPNANQSGAQTIITAQPGLIVNNCHFDGSPSAHIVLQAGADDAYIANCKFKPSGTISGVCIQAGTALATAGPSDDAIYNCVFTVSGGGYGIDVTNADNLDIGYCIGKNTSSDAAVEGALVYITGSDAALYNLYVHDCVGTELAGLIVESSTSLAAHGFGTADLANVSSGAQTYSDATTSIEQILYLPNYFNNNAYGCTLLFDTAD